MRFHRMSFKFFCMAAMFMATCCCLGQDDQPLPRVPTDPERPWEDIPWSLRKGKKPNLISENELRVEITTDKRVYRIGEPVIVIIKITNLTDHKLYMCRNVSRSYGLLHHIFVYARENTSDKTDIHANENAQGQQQALPGSAKEVEAPKTALGVIVKEITDSFSLRNFTLPEHGESISTVLVNLFYDIIPFNRPFQGNEPATYRILFCYDVYHESNSLIAEFTVKAETTFEVTPDFTSPAQMLSDKLEIVFGKNKAIDLLCAEADAILGTLREQPEMQYENSDKYQRLIKILDSLGGLCELEFTDRLEYLKLYNRVSLDDFAELVSKCRDMRQGVNKE